MRPETIFASWQPFEMRCSCKVWVLWKLTCQLYIFKELNYMYLDTNIMFILKEIINYCSCFDLIICVTVYVSLRPGIHVHTVRILSPHPRKLELAVKLLSRLHVSAPCPHPHLLQWWIEKWFLRMRTSTDYLVFICTELRTSLSGTWSTAVSSRPASYFTK